ncbi:MAG TPA: hypothetical protein VN200_02915 [Rhodoglobus sp.]|nr:hypothetical protein [Rhodoglobus sp.]
MDPVIPLEALQFVRDLRIPGERAALYRDVAANRYVQVTRGVFVPSPLWEGARPEERHRAMMAALAELRPGTVFTGLSAAIGWQRPFVGVTPSVPLVAGGPGASHSTKTFRVLESSTPFEPIDVGGYAVTPLPRALVDTARRGRLSTALAAMDHALSDVDRAEAWPRSARVSPSELLDVLANGSPVGRARAARAISLADGASGSAGESASRGLMHLLAVPPPVLQQAHVDDEGLIGVTDYCWPDLRVVGEFDGLGKYLDERLRGDRTAGEVVVAEKLREDRLRALGFTVVRWGWAELMQPALLIRKLRRAGIPTRSSIPASEFLVGR